MNKIITLITLLLITVLPAPASTPGQKVGVTFDTTEYDFGNTAETADDGYVIRQYTFTNTGTAPVAVITATASCGCTRPEYTKKPVAPGKKGTVKVTFNKRGQRGEVSKDIRIRLRSADGKTEKITLRLTGVVVPQ